LNNELKPYINLVDFLAELLGPTAEIVLHDISNLEHSIVAIRNNFISGRKIGDPVTDLVLQILKNNQYSHDRFLCNYKTKSRSGKYLKSATYFVKNSDDTIIAMLCINMDMSNYANLRDQLDSLLSFQNTTVSKNEVKEAFSNSIQELSLDKINEIVSKSNISAERMSQEEKIQYTKTMDDLGLFLIKGAVTEAANALKVSEASIYRYLNKIKKENL